MPNRNVVGDYRYDYQGQELDKETGKVAFELRLYDPRINRWLTTDPAGQYHSPYMAMGNNWVRGVDSDGAKWKPDKNGNLVAEAGDNAQTLADYKGISLADAQKFISDQGLFTDYNNGPGTNLMEGQTLTLDNPYTRSIANSSGDLTLDRLIAGSSLTGKVPEDNYNCWGAACAGSQGIEINTRTSQMPLGSTYDAILTSSYTNTDLSNLKFGETVIRFATPSGVTHGAVYYGTSQDGTIYTFTKNGWDVRPEIMKLSRFSSEPILSKTYGPITGMLSTHTGFYNPK